ncbi:MAG: hypothetical protein EKK39_14345 [Sphingobacteriales bacterium]|uniref:DUF5675 family protein n=1 Tax=Hydrotalea flava TaxID=714549 RepID=UPI00083673E8|nr:DUF5675 family protein [Hydrotalea flava]RTL47386.1 MAG: hypothetical protein EKK39_14345 [Sphingobacteriales bacterium]
MLLLLFRTYHKEGTNGELWREKQLLCHTIELPWQHNLPHISCIPEGMYTIVPRENERLGKHIAVLDVPGRKGILLHPANDARRELQGCLAPVKSHTGPGRGILSRQAMTDLLDYLQPAFEQDEKVQLLILNVSDQLKTLARPGQM